MKIEYKLIILMILNLIDGVLTKMGVGFGFKELNPIYYLGNFYFIKTLIIVSLVILYYFVYKYFIKQRRVIDITVNILNFIMLLVIINNIIVIGGLK